VLQFLHISFISTSSRIIRSRQRLQVMKLIMQHSTKSGHFFSPWSKHSPQHPVLKHLQYVFVPQ
jgi:hypothetical protein